MTDLGPLGAIAIVAAGCAAGAINTIVGSGSLITFPTLLALGYPPLIANVTNTVGLIPGSLSGAVGYRRELVGQRRRLVWLAGPAAAGALAGAALLLVLPPEAFEVIVPLLILVACLLVAVQPTLSRRIRERRARVAAAAGASAGRGPAAPLAVFGTSIYGGYFGAAQGVILMAALGTLVDDDLQRLNAAKNVITAVVNGTAAIVFVLLTQVAWDAALLLAAGATAGGQLGARLGRRLSPRALRFVIIAIGLLAVVRQLA